ncbi:unnamed protein product [Cylindrotheca closterium]|uniref:DUF6824 domain-containing protein n=1 Tax=Cylindrotheca closterium TaxID=2856 RepID=A0AAD2CWG9_9STRA|nr:unnamed protein product [Cylindrotheca closterium]
MSTISFLFPNMNLMALEPSMFAHSPDVAADHMYSSLLNMACAPQSPAIPAGVSNKGYQCTDELLLPEDFQPCAYSVICGRGRKSTDAVGNRRLAVIASLFAQRYSEATKKDEKTHIVSEILEIMRSASPNPQHAFVRHSKGSWFRVENLHAREKIGTVLRDTLHSQYRSSTKSKLAKRKQRKDRTKKQTKKKEEVLPEPSLSLFSLDNEVHGDLDDIFA